MKITSLQIKRQESYEQDAGQLRGLVTLTGPSGSQSLVLSPSAVVKIFDVIAQEVRTTAAVNAQHVKSAFEDVKAEGLLLEHTIEE